ncbi:MAG: LuxR C-terminal-related transcriptional regulator [Chthoniobacter sp.]
MKNLLSDTDYEEVLDCIQAIYRCRKLETFPRDILTTLGKLVDCCLAGYNEVDLPRNRFVVVFDPPQPDIEAHLYEKFAGLMHEHPVITYFDKTGDGQALKISDFLSVSEYHERAIYRDCYRHLAVEDQLSLGMQMSTGFMIGIVFNRQERSFTEQDRLRLNLVRPHIVQAYLHAEELAGHEKRQVDLHAVLRENGVGVIATNRAGEVLHSTPGAFECLAGYLPIPKGDTPGLPRRVAEWLRQGDVDGPVAPLVVAREPDRLIVRRVLSEDRCLLLLSEESGLAFHQRLDRFALTPREREVLRWVAEGKTNSEIAVILGLTTGTVKLHVERILVKLGVENRTAAALVVHGTA